MARFNIVTLVNDSDKDFIDKWDGEEYIIPAHGELQVPDFIAHHWVGKDPVDVKRAMERRGEGGKNAIGVTIYIKQEESPKDEQFLVEGAKPIAKVKVPAKPKPQVKEE